MSDREISKEPRKQRATGLLLYALAAGAVACVTIWTPPVPQSYHRTNPIADAELIGAEEPRGYRGTDGYPLSGRRRLLGLPRIGAFHSFVVDDERACTLGIDLFRLP